MTVTYACIWNYGKDLLSIVKAVTNIQTGKRKDITIHHGKAQPIQRVEIHSVPFLSANKPLNGAADGWERYVTICLEYMI